MRVVLSRSSSIGSFAIRLATADSRHDVSNGWSHCALVSPDGQHVIDSMFTYGVRRRTMGSYLGGFPDSLVVKMNFPEHEGNHFWEDAIWEAALKEVGKSYDTVALAAFIAPDFLSGRRNWQDPNQWFCSELLAMLVRSFADPKLFARLGYVSPNDIAALRS